MRNVQDGIALHTIPFYGDDRPESKKRRKRWVDFVKLKHAKWEPSKTSVICSKHFKIKADDFVLAACQRGKHMDYIHAYTSTLVEKGLSKALQCTYKKC